ncbi:site-specific DNA-methyltransferase [Butyrivibrio sp. XPD2006]|uniref:site-specific DNA-methyltransferase n=1 Tax=Butyrivibrio sp. XPD2006 TaxID=1280668 RepID=UPI0003B5C37C|nr:site-specific DNA-methyltransferase [Butyrivibrio sp. XPD2006]
MPTLDWIGKSKVVNHHLDVPYHVLERKYSFDENGQHDEDNGSENMIIHGDNLIALKSLLPHYEGRIKCVYIDPPYNTGNENWVYNDNVNDTKINEWLGNVVGKDGDDLSRHDKWLCMMYPRLKLIHRLLSDEGAIFISIDDNEITYLRNIMDEIFGASNFISQITLKCNPKGRSQDKYFATSHEYLLVYAKSLPPKGFFSVLKDEDQIRDEYREDDHDGRGPYRSLELRNTHREFGKENRPNLFYPFYVNESDGSFSLEKDEVHTIEVLPLWPDGYEGCWTWDKPHSLRDNSYLKAKNTNGVWKIYRKSYAYEDGEAAKKKLFTIWDNPLFYTEKGQDAFGELFPGTNKNDFPQPKSVEYVKEAIRTITHDGDIILDSFAGSGTTAHSTLKLNKETDENRHFILIEREDYADRITAERAKRVINGYSSEEGAGGNFSYYELGPELFLGENLNESLEVQYIREYIYFTETKSPIPEKDENDVYLLGVHSNNAIYFYYEKDKLTTLNKDFLATIKTPAESYTIYADKCTLSDSELERFHIEFKKIPRDIRRF